MRLAVVGHRTWFANHYPEGWERAPSVLALDVFEGDYSWLMALRNWWPDLTLFYRPELYPSRFLHRIPGRRVAFLSEPLRDGAMEATEESALRLAVYRGMDWAAYHDRLYYDAGRRATTEHLGWPLTGYRPLPLDTAHFHPGQPGDERPVDLCFVSKATPHRIAMLDFLRLFAHALPVGGAWRLGRGARGAVPPFPRRAEPTCRWRARAEAAPLPRRRLRLPLGDRAAFHRPRRLPRPHHPPAQPPGRGAAARGGEAAKRQGWTARDEAERLSLGVRRMLAEETGLAVPAPPLSASLGEAPLPRLLA